MDMNRIRYFLSLAKTGSITKASELHHISAAAFSKAIKVFESEVGEPLTTPQGRGLILTDYAKALVPKLESIIRQIESIHEGMGAVDGRKTLRVATFEVFSTHFMARAIRDSFHDFRCEIHEAIPGRMEEAVASGKSDLALTYIPIPHPDLDFLEVAKIEMGIYGNCKLVTGDDYAALPFAAPVSPIEGSPNKVQGLDGWPDDAFPRNIQFHVEMLQTALNLCSSGLAVAYLPKFVVELHNDMTKTSLNLKKFEVPRGFPKTRDYVYLVKRKSDQEGAAAKKLAQALRKICSS